jgi:methionyl aminopeptidase
MIHYKSQSEIRAMQEGGKILSDVLSQVVEHVKPGVNEIELDELANRQIRKYGGEPGFMRVKGYKHSICASTNDVVVHGIPGKYTLKEGDIIGIDCGVFFKGLNTDMSETVGVGKIKPEVEKFLEVGKLALFNAIEEAHAGNRIGNISQTIQSIVEGAGFSVVRNLIGHGVGKQLHEDPEIPGVLFEKITNTPPLKPGMTIAVEVIYNMGKPDVYYFGNDGWTIKTKDHSLSGVFERSIAITNNKPVMLTP